MTSGRRPKSFSALGACDFRDGGEDGGRMSGGAFDGEARVDEILGSFGVGVDEREMVVKFGAVAGEIPAQQRRVRRENRLHGNAFMRDARDGGRRSSTRENARRSAGTGAAAVNARKNSVTTNPNATTSLTFAVIRLGRDAVILPEKIFIAIERPEPAAVIQQNHAGGRPERAIARNATRAPYPIAH